MSSVDSSVEIESKFELTAEEFERLRTTGRVMGCDRQLNVYYDLDNKLADAAITLRVRFRRNAPPRLTLKIPMEKDGARRSALEIEAEYGRRLPRRQFVVDSELPGEFAAALGARGIEEVRRLGWMRTTRWLVDLSDGVEVELDRVDLPGGRVFFEVEVEEPEEQEHRKAVDVIRQRAAGAVPSRVSKFERFVALNRPTTAGDSSI